MMTHRNSDDRWTLWGSDILSPPNLALLKDHLQVGPIIVEHRHYRGARSPDRFVFDDIDVLKGYIEANSIPGDDFWVWDFESVCRNENYLVHGKVPDQDGCTPQGGAY